VRFDNLASYVVAAIVFLGLVITAVILLLLVAAAVVLALLGVAAAWIAWRCLPFRRSALLTKSPIERLTDHYVSGRIDLGEFEARVAKVLKNAVHLH
jgi:protein-S-isoprenylcysteine O-methyltransferase Ste14